MIRRLLYGLLLLSARIEAAPPNPIVRLIEDNDIKSVGELLKAMPESWKMHWIPQIDSQSRQEGLRLVVEIPEHRTTFSFNVDPNQPGYSSLEIKTYDPDRRQIAFIDVAFEKDLLNQNEKVRPRQIPEFNKGRHITLDALHSYLDGNLVNCASCHSGGDSRFDLRSVLPKLNADSLKSVITSLKNREGTRLNNLPLSVGIQEALKKEDRKALENYWSEEAKRIHRHLASQNAQVIVQGIEDRLKKVPHASLGLIGILKGCSLEMFLTQTEWRKRMSYFSGANGYEEEKRKAFAELVWDAKDKRPPVEKALMLVHQVVERDRNDAAVSGIDDPGMDLEKIARLEFFWDPIEAELNRAVPLERHDSLIPVVHWGMTAHHKAYWFDGMFPEFAGLLEERLERFVREHYPLPKGKIECEAIAEISRAQYSQYESTPNGQAEGRLGH